MQSFVVLDAYCQRPVLNDKAANEEEIRIQKKEVGFLHVNLVRNSRILHMHLINFTVFTYHSKGLLFRI